MRDYDPSTYGNQMAGVYDDWFGNPRDENAAVAFLSELAGSGPALELGIGTGRIALPLAWLGIEVQGIDASEKMVEKRRIKPGGTGILDPHIGEIADVGVEGNFSLVYVVFNTFFGLLSQEDQARCFANVAHLLGETGKFVIEAFVPDPTRFEGGQTTQIKQVEVDWTVLETSRHDPVSQRVDMQSVVIGESGTKLYPVSIRYAWPSELDLMARLAGLRLRERWEDWNKASFTATSGSHVSVYERI